MDKPAIDRRTVLATGLAVSGSLATPPGVAGAKGSLDMKTEPTTNPTSQDVVLTVNGADQAIRVDTRMTLLDALRGELDLTGSKKGCDQGQCGACTIHT